MKRVLPGVNNQQGALRAPLSTLSESLLSLDHPLEAYSWVCCHRQIRAADDCVRRDHTEAPGSQVVAPPVRLLLRHGSKQRGADPHGR
jgi:hypothetical protein